MTFLLLWWAASRPVETCWVTLDVESTHASLSLRQREWRWRPSLSTCHTHIQTHTHTVLCSIASSFCQTRIPDMIWNTVSPPLLPSCHASDVEGNQGVCTCWQGSVYACVYMHVNVTTPTEGMYKISLYTFRLLYAQYVSWLCVCWVSYINICTCILCVCVCVCVCVWEREREIISLKSADLLTPFISFHTWPPMIKAWREGRCARSLPSQHSSFMAHLPWVLLGVGGGSWILTSIFFLPLLELSWGKARMKSMSP